MIEWLAMRRLFFLTVFAFLTSCNQNVEVVNSDERLEDLPPVRPSVGEPFGSLGGSVGRPEAEVPPFVKAFFMHTWVEALYGPPANRNPNPNWSSPLVDPVNGRVWCTDCHISGSVDFSQIPKQRVPLVDQLENDHEFMADLMGKWVERLNSEDYGAREKLEEAVTCLTCHETNPDPQ